MRTSIHLSSKPLSSTLTLCLWPVNLYVLVLVLSPPCWWLPLGPLLVGAQKLVTEWVQRVPRSHENSAGKGLSFSFPPMWAPKKAKDLLKWYRDRDRRLNNPAWSPLLTTDYSQSAVRRRGCQAPTQSSHQHRGVGSVVLLYYK